MSTAEPRAHTSTTEPQGHRDRTMGEIEQTGGVRLPDDEAELIDMHQRLGCLDADYARLRSAYQEREQRRRLVELERDVMQGRRDT